MEEPSCQTGATEADTGEHAEAWKLPVAIGQRFVASSPPGETTGRIALYGRSAAAVAGGSATGWRRRHRSRCQDPPSSWMQCPLRQRVPAKGARRRSGYHDRANGPRKVGCRRGECGEQRLVALSWGLACWRPPLAWSPSPCVPLCRPVLRVNRLRPAGTLIVATVGGSGASYSPGSG